MFNNVVVHIVNGLHKITAIVNYTLYRGRSYDVNCIQPQRRGLSITIFISIYYIHFTFRKCYSHTFRFQS
jgi:hypothetical protein